MRKIVRRKKLVRKRVSLNLHPQTYGSIQNAVKRLNDKRSTRYTMQRFIEEAILRRISEDWRTL